MNGNIQSLVELKRKIGIARTKTERAAGVLDQILSTLKKDWDCSTIEEAKEKLRSMSKKMEKLATEYKEKSVKFEEVWGEELRKIS